ncbi:hypothetical protein I4F81_002884 [Pyropia yezoensis]|uniref:Uncharacterized protein n=1 Tax=Pyropia yezoensis TaxID=2788 RepID=A0ACC3BQM4_PYRYE|nr:hypothetical protein I4F81_002884 [Neopyropia yezoensis]
MMRLRHHHNGNISGGGGSKPLRLYLAPLRYARATSSLFRLDKGVDGGGSVPRGFAHLVFSAICLATLWSVASLTTRSLGFLRPREGAPWATARGVVSGGGSSSSGDATALWWWASPESSPVDVLGWGASFAPSVGTEALATSQLRDALQAQFSIPRPLLRRLRRAALEDLLLRLRGPAGAAKTAVVAMIGADFGSRLRALGLCLAFASETDRVLIVDWVRDGFFYPTFADMFASHAGFFVLEPEEEDVDPEAVVVADTGGRADIRAVDALGDGGGLTPADRTSGGSAASLAAAAAASVGVAQLAENGDDWAGLTVRTFDYAHGAPAETVDETAHLGHHVALVTGAGFFSSYASTTVAMALLRQSVVPTAAAAAAFHNLTGLVSARVDSPVAIGAVLHNAHDIPWAFVRSLTSTHQRELLQRLDSAAVANPDRKPRVLFMHVQFGLGNRLRSLGAGMAIAEATGRELVLIWERDVHLNAGFHDFFSNDILCVEKLRLTWPFDTRADTKLVDIHALTFMRKDRVDVLSAGAHVLDMDAVASQHLYIKTAYVVRTTLPLMQDGAQSKPYSPVCIAMRTLSPVLPVLRLVEANVANRLANTVGVHVRSRSLARDIVGLANPVAEYGSEKSMAVTDYWRNTTQLPAFVDKMRSFNDTSLRFYVAADDADVIGALATEFPGRILRTPRLCDDRGSVCMRYALADMILLSRTKLILGSYWSSFTEAAMRLGSQNVHLAGVDFGVRKDVALPGAIVDAMHPAAGASAGSKAVVAAVGAAAGGGTVSRSGAAPAHHDAAPAHHDTTPGHRHTTPAHHDTTPAHYDSTPAHLGAAPAHTAAAPAHPSAVAPHHSASTANHIAGADVVHAGSGPGSPKAAGGVSTHSETEKAGANRGVSAPG